MGFQGEGLRAAFKSPAREGRDTRRLQRVGSSYRRTQDKGTGMQSMSVSKGRNLLGFGIRAHAICGSSQCQESNPD